ncbi:DUF1194 domain-containing protein [Rhodobacteraceae bacterium CCMM004]|nr:DUF1194 domain-containing protein [Rhodobacteraceae bacterium CCMM004]
MGEHGKHRTLVGPLIALALWAGAVPAAAQCRLALVLGMDISSSVDPDEDRLQRQGLARALMAPEVQRAAFALPDSPVALAIYEWSGRYQQKLIVDWTILNGQEDLARAARAVATSERSYAEFPTALGFAIGYAASIFERGPPCLFKTLDISGDGSNNDGFGPDRAYEHFPLAEVTVNGLSIGGHDKEVADYYRRELLRGPGAFLEQATGFEDFERAMRKKLEREMGVRVLGAVR